MFETTYSLYLKPLLLIYLFKYLMCIPALDRICCELGQNMKKIMDLPLSTFLNIMFKIFFFGYIFSDHSPIPKKEVLGPYHERN